MWILLDNQFTINIFCNKDLLRDVHKVGRRMRVQCNAGWTVTDLIGRLQGYPGEVWYNPNGIANILSLSDTTKYFCVHYDSGVDSTFILEKPNGMQHWFLKTTAGLYYHDTAAPDPDDDSGVVLVTTVASKKSRYTDRAY